MLPISRHIAHPHTDNLFVLTATPPHTSMTNASHTTETMPHPPRPSNQRGPPHSQHRTDGRRKVFSDGGLAGGPPRHPQSAPDQTAKMPPYS
eukprot:15278495-Alexandrium_andersonii.AAC.1